MFSGQGSQYYQMGAGLFRTYPFFQKQIRLMDKQAADLMGESVIDYVYDPKRRKSDPFDSLRYSHPALFMQQYALAELLRERGISPDYVMGTSMGEFVSAAVAGVMSAQDILTMVIQQAKNVEQCCLGGGMLAVLHDPDIYETNPIFKENSTLAAVNTSEHFVVSGTLEGLNRISLFLKEKNIAYLLLHVSGAYHSGHIDPAASVYKEFLKQYVFRQPEIPLISCSRAAILDRIPQDYFWEVVREAIRFKETVRYLENRGTYIYLDLGPSGTLANFLAQNLGPDSRSEYLATLTPFNSDEKQFEKVCQFFSKKSRPDIYRSGRNIQKKGNIMKAFVFPGQGSQKKGMGGSLFDEFQKITSKADEICGYSVKELCIEDPHERLGQTDYTQPALYVVNALMWAKKTAENQTVPNFLAGHSLGEYNALYAAGAFDFETGLRLVKERGRLMALAQGGGMAAVVGLDEKKIAGILQENGFSDIGIANYNSSGQIVIAGLAADIEKAEPIFQKAGARTFIRLKVSAAFHSPYMADAAYEFTNFLEPFSFGELRIPVISNVTARPYPNEDSKNLLIAQMTSPVQWVDSIRYLMGKGVTEFEETGPGNVLTGLIRRIKKECTPLTEEQVAGCWGPGAGDRVLGAGEKKQEIFQNKTGGIITASSLGSAAFRKEFGLKYAYIAGGMFRGIASADMVIAMGKAGMMGYFGAGGLDPEVIEQSIRKIQTALNGEPFGMNFLHNYENPEAEEKFVDIYLKYGIKDIEASAYMQMSPALVRYRLSGLQDGSNGAVFPSHRIMAKLSRPEVARVFLSPAPERIVNRLLEKKKITPKQAELSRNMPMADAICVEADSGGHTDAGMPYTLMPAILRLREEVKQEFGYEKHIFIGAAGGIGTPEAAAAAFILGAEFVLTGSINQCTAEAATSDVVKDLLQQINVQDTDYAPAGDMFETGAKIQVMKKGVFFPARANRLYELYRQYNALEEIDAKTRQQLEEKYFKRKFDDIWEDTKSFFRLRDPEQIKKAEKNPKHKMSLIFRWYFAHSVRVALEGKAEEKVNFQVHTGPALGAFNQWVKGTELEDWRNRHADAIGKKLMEETAILLNQRFEEMNMG